MVVRATAENMKSLSFRAVLPCVALLLCASDGVQASLLRSAPKYGSNLAQSNITDVCWKGTYGRGVGTVIDTCRPPLVRSGALCYPECQANYTGVGPVCWGNCPAGWVDEGWLCREEGHIKTIAKKSYGRGAGKVLECPLDKEYDAGLCYTPCKPGYYGVGPVCWEHCPASRPVNGGALCCENAQVCTTKIRDLCAGIPMAIAKAIIAGDNWKAIAKAAMDAINAVLGFIMPICSTL